MFTNSQNRSLLLTLFAISVVGSLYSALFVLTLRNEVSIQEAIQKGLVTATINGTTEDGHFAQPMLGISLQNQTYFPLTVVIDQGLQLESTTGHGSLITLRTERISMFWPQRSARIFAYTQNFTESFPDVDARYQINPAVPVEQSSDVGNILNSLAALDAHGELSGQLALWRIMHHVELDQLEPILGHRFPLETHHRVEELIVQNFPAAQPKTPLYRWLGFEILFTLLTFLFGSLYWRFTKETNRTLTGIIEQFGGKYVHHLSEWQLLITGRAVEVWAAVDTRQEGRESVIVKFPRPDIKRAPREQVKGNLEADEQHQNLAHQNIVPSLESGQYIHPITNRKTDYLIQERIEGYTLKHLIERQPNKRLSNSLITKVTSQILDALAYMHTEKIAHRALTLTDVMLNQSGQVYLVSFANAILSDINETSYVDLTAPSTPISIEDMLTSDLYSLAIIVSVMYGCKLPTSTNVRDVQESMEEQLKGREDVPEWVCNTIHKCLNLDNHDNITLQDFVYIPQYQSVG